VFVCVQMYTALQTKTRKESRKASLLLAGVSADIFRNQLKQFYLVKKIHFFHFSTFTSNQKNPSWLEKMIACATLIIAKSASIARFHTRLFLGRIKKGIQINVVLSPFLGYKSSDGRHIVTAIFLMPPAHEIQKIFDVLQSEVHGNLLIFDSKAYESLRHVTGQRMGHVFFSKKKIHFFNQ